MRKLNLILNLNLTISGSFLNGILEFSDDAGNVLANLEKKTTCRDSIATVSCKRISGFLNLFK